MAIRGQLDRLKLFQVFRSLMQKRMTGVLTLQSGREIRRAEVVNGYPVRTASNRRSESLFAALVLEGLISSTEEVQLRAHVQQTRVPIDALLVEHGFVSPRRLRSVQRTVARRILLAPFAWTDGAFQFEEQVVRPGPNAEGIDLVDILVEAAARVVTDELSQQFVRRYAGQYVAPTELLRMHGRRFDTFFPAPNTRTMLEAPARFDLIARTRKDHQIAAREVTCLVLSGLAQFQTTSQIATPDAGSAASRPAARSSRQIRRVSAPANLRGRSASAAQPASSRPARGAPAPPTGAPPPNAAPPPPTGAPPPSRAPRATSQPVANTPPPRRRPRQAQPSAAQAGGGAPPAARAAPKTGRGKKTPTTAILAAIELAQTRVPTLEELTHYDILGVGKSADTKAIRTTFRKLAREFHVDKFSRYELPEGAIESVQAYFIAINRAHETLSNEADRANYDAELQLRSQGIEVDAAGGGPDINKVFAAEKLIKQGITLLKNGKPTPALERFTEALETIPDDPLARAGHAYSDYLVAQAQGSGSQMVLARSIRILEEVCAELEGRHEPFLYLGRLYRMSNSHDKAVAVLMKSLKISPHCAETASELRHLQRKPATKKSSLFSRRKR